MNRFLHLDQEVRQYKKIRERHHRRLSSPRHISRAQGKMVTSKSQIADWVDLINFKPPQELVNQLRRRGIEIQDIESFPHTFANDVNLDFYAVKIRVLPGTLKEDPDRLLHWIRNNLSGLTRGWAKWRPYQEQDKDIWESNNPYGAAVLIDLLGPDDALVVCTKSDIDHWVFTTAKHGRDSVTTDEPGEHPVTGNRYFGYYKDHADDSLVVYTRGADRKTVGIVPLVFEAGDQNWKTFQNNLVSTINKAGGKAEKYTTEQHFFNWESVKPFL